MNQSNLNMLINLFKKSRDIVWITDENWEILWGRYAYNQKRSLPEMLKLPQDLWDNVEKQTYWEGHSYDCKIYCSKPNKCRIIILKTLEMTFGMPEEVAIDSAVHSLRQVKWTIQEYLNQHEIDDMPEFLETIERNCYLLYHKSFILRMLKSVREGRAIQNLFSVQEALQKVQMKIKQEMGIYAESLLIGDETEILLRENKDFFNAVILAAVVLCHQDEGYFHRILFSVYNEGRKVELKVQLKPDYQQAINMSRQIDSANFGSFDEEKNLLNAFCSIHDGEWEISEQKDHIHCCRIVFQIDEEHQQFEFHQPSKIAREDSNELYRVMLSRVYLSYF